VTKRKCNIKQCCHILTPAKLSESRCKSYLCA